MSLSMIDESAYQASFWTAAALKVNGIKVVAIKVTEGIGWFSSYYAWQLQQARNAGCVVLHYHLAHPETNSAANEMKYFVSKVTPQPGELIVLDVEPQIFTLIPATAASTWVSQFSGLVKSQWGVLPVIYSAGSTISNGGLESVRGKNPLWYAFPGANPASPPAPPKPWLISFLQYSVNSKWSSSGTDVDAAYFSSKSQLAPLAIPPTTVMLTAKATDKRTSAHSSRTKTFQISRI